MAAASRNFIGPLIGPFAWAPVLALGLVSGAVAQTSEDNAETTVTTAAPELGPAVFIAIDGERAYRVDEWIDAPVVLSDTGDEIGEVETLMLGEDGQTIAAIVEVGGFLGIGGKQVAVDIASLQAVRENGDFNLRLNATREQIEQASPVVLDD